MKYLFYLLPGVLNIVTGLLFFITAKRMADAGVSSLAVTATLPMWALTYAVSSYIIGKYTTKRNAVKILFASQIILFFSLLGLLLTPSVKLQYLYLFGSGLGTGLFFAPFQVVIKLFEKVEISAETFARSAATYTFSWSCGQGTGPFLAAVVWGAFDPVNGWKYCYIVTLAITVFVLISLVFMQKFINRRLAENDSAAAVNTEYSEKTADTLKLPDIMKAVWVISFGGYLALAVLRSYLPDYATKVLHFPTSSQGIMLSLISFVQAFAALACIKARRWQFRPYVLAFCAVLAMISLLTVSMCSGSLAAWLAAGLFGVFSGILSFDITYHALANVDKSARYASVNETIVGSTSVLAPLAAGMLADSTTAQMPFYALIAALLIAAVIYCRMTWRYRKF